MVGVLGCEADEPGVGVGTAEIDAMQRAQVRISPRFSAAGGEEKDGSAEEAV